MSNALKFFNLSFVIYTFWAILFISACKEKSSSEKEIVKPTKSEAVKIHITWENKNFPLEMKIYEPSTKRQYEIWETGNFQKTDDAPISSEIANSEILMEPGSKKVFVLLVKNTTKEPVYFFAAPHHVIPEELSLGFKFKCLCVNHAFKVPPNEYWFRVVELIMSKKYLGDKIEIKHSLVGIDEERMKEFEANSKSN